MLDFWVKIYIIVGMKNIKQIVADNLRKIRKENNLTQVEFAKKINYSDKAVSRWENCEVVPDIETLQKISEVYGLSIAYFFNENNESPSNPKQNFVQKYNQIIMLFLSICVVCVFATVLFVYLNMIYNYVFWQIFVWAVPVSLFVAIYFNKKWGNRTWTLVLSSVALWSLIASFYLQFLAQNIWLIFIIGLPIQALIIVASFLKTDENT